MTATATSQPEVPDGTYVIWPKAAKAFQHAAGYIDKAPHALSWWIIAYKSEEGYCLHTGSTSLGCVTVTEHQKWEDIYSILLLARSSDSLYSGKITIMGQALVA
ncbi:hypothetical protein [Mesorhizobium sp. L48C026A00]|uniref:hypothetical protein n=1 Tax=Mesorhizobium sp. L48C026A00 TaxID=1287182 RepID=UPI0003CFB167|nr:hypothetical protein [Mesorhizobium sp. L48C026A00]ESZ10159.1 hypothetical protein X737_32165 [Mesorhizobium sp. L48C026A00]